MMMIICHICTYLPHGYHLSHIENGLAAFTGKLNDYFEQHISDRSGNLSFFQRRALKKLQADPSMHICDTDKNIGPTAISKRVYLKQVYEEHLSMSTYFRLNEKECKEFNVETRIMLQHLFHDQCGIPKA
jgi:hypothetical protein